MKKNQKKKIISIILREQTPKAIATGEDYTKTLLFDKKNMVEAFLRFCHGNKKAIGLASNQVAYNKKRISDRFFAIRDLEDLNKWKLIIDPHIKSYGGEPEVKTEKCLTWPGFDIIAKRYPSIVVSYYDINNNFVENRIIEEFESQIWQHEIAHLDGIKEEVVSKTFKRENNKVGRNDSCPCGSGKKYKKCCLKT